MSDFPEMPEAPTCGWDTVFAVPAWRVNQAIVDRGSSPKKLEAHDSELGLQVQALFGDWQICPGGDGGLVSLMIPIRNLMATKRNGETVNVSELRAKVQVQLKFYSSTQDPSIPGNEHHLRLCNPALSPDEGHVVSVDFQWGDNRPKSRLTTFGIQQVIEEWFDAHIAEFEHVFAVAVLNDQIDDGAWSFVKPRQVDYAYVESNNGGDGVMAVLCMTTPDPSPNVRQVSKNAIPPQSQAGFLLSPRLLLGNLMLTAFKNVWTNCKDDDFECQSDLLQLKQGHAFDLPPVYHDGGTYTPRLQDMTIRVYNQMLEIQSHTVCPVSPGIQSTCHAKHFYTIGLEMKNGQPTIAFQELKHKAQEHKEVLKDDSVQITEEVLKWVAIGGLILSVILVPFTNGMSLAIGGVVFGLLLGLTEVTMLCIEKYRAGDAPSVDMLVIQATSPIRWDANHIFELNYAGLNNSLQLGGTWHG